MRMAIDWPKLLEKAKEARDKAYAPYSHFPVGAALLSSSGKIYTGCNIENSSFSLSMCAERVAIYKAKSEQEDEFLALAIISASESLPFPCGACRQVLTEFSTDLPILIANRRGETHLTSLNALLPSPFNRKSLTEGGK